MRSRGAEGQSRGAKGRSGGGDPRDPRVRRKSNCVFSATCFRVTRLPVSFSASPSSFQMEKDDYSRRYKYCTLREGVMIEVIFQIVGFVIVRAP